MKIILALVSLGLFVCVNGAAVNDPKLRRKRSHMKYHTPEDATHVDSPVLANCGNRGQGTIENLIWYQGCQTCSCSLQGEETVVCTTRSCLSPMQKRRRRGLVSDHADHALKLPKNTNDFRIHVPYSHCHGHMQDETYYLGCNICRCDVGGIEYCQMKRCPRHRRRVNEVADENYSRVSETACTEARMGKHISDGCHLCKCSEYGIMCTRNWCPSIVIDYKK